jgi:hypothetical protein
MHNQSIHPISCSTTLRLMHIAVTWVIGRIFTVSYNALVKYSAWGLRLNINEYNAEQSVAPYAPQAARR